MGDSEEVLKSSILQSSSWGLVGIENKKEKKGGLLRGEEIDEDEVPPGLENGWARNSKIRGGMTKMLRPVPDEEE